ncbi:hypothetical protein [Xanthomonas melonis]|uniref:hypothetical protein n=1 Tax=Xanthomonas melonis TaxID=56456 RepID=UPI001E5A0279|nr:hypothetical protein [Xanthomonas melonis]
MKRLHIVAQNNGDQPVELLDQSFPRLNKRGSMMNNVLSVRDPSGKEVRCAAVLAAFVVHHHSVSQVRQQQRRIAAIAGRKEAGNRIGQGKCHGGVSSAKRVCHHRQLLRRPSERTQGK